MAAWSLVSGPATAPPDTPLTRAGDVKLTAKLTEPSTLAFTIDGRHPQAARLTELGTDVHLLREGSAVYSGRLGATEDAFGDAQHTTAVSTADLRALLARRLVRTSRTYTNVDVAVIARDLIIEAQLGGGGGLGIAIPDPAVRVGVTVTREVLAGAKILDELQAIAGGTQDAAARVFDWDLTPGWSGRALALWAPARGRASGVVLDYTFDPTSPRTSVVASLKRALDPGEYANLVYVSGGTHTETSTTTTTTATTPVVQQAPTGAAITTPDSTASTIVRGTRSVSTDPTGATVTRSARTVASVGGTIIDAPTEGTPDVTQEQAQGSGTTPVTRGTRTLQPAVAPNPATSNPAYTSTTATQQVTTSTSTTVSVEVPNAPVTLADGSTAWQLGVWATAEAFNDVTTQAELNAKAAQRLAELRQVAPTYTLTLRTGFWQGPAHLWVGDTITLNVSSGRLVEVVDLRITQVEVALSPDGEEVVTLTVGAARSLLSTLLEHTRRIAALERATSAR